jgi:hypothetical protein
MGVPVSTPNSKRTSIIARLLQHCFVRRRNVAILSIIKLCERGQAAGSRNRPTILSDIFWHRWWKRGLYQDCRNWRVEEFLDLAKGLNGLAQGCMNDGHCLSRLGLKPKYRMEKCRAFSFR